ncbi:uncharacterized protein G2W53_035334 [Senna tora]|uniref:Uncharacterized protein n=1 Tax=Senna tora TaxID=362788 RepID=A0A834SSH5_9FABA|nr:uncharacterized protein G2W53_035334 [Senna tora]
MSTPLEKNESKSSIEKQKVSGMEEQKAPLLDYQSNALHMKVTSILKKRVSESVNELKKRAKNSGTSSMVVPTSNHKSEAADNVTPKDKTKRKRKSMTTSILMADFSSVSFKIPQALIDMNIDMDRLALNCEDPSKQPDPLQFSFIERLQNWNIQYRKRPEGRWDMFYRYGANPKRLFRSMSEVTDFIAYEICPAESPRKKTKKADNTGNDEDPSETIEKVPDEAIDDKGVNNNKPEEENQQKDLEKDDNEDKTADEVINEEGMSCKSEEENQQKDLGNDEMKEKAANEVFDEEGMSCKSEEDNQQKDLGNDEMKDKAADEVINEEGMSCKSEEDNQQKDLGNDEMKEKAANEVFDEKCMSCKLEEDNQQKDLGNDEMKEKAADDVIDDEGTSSIDVGGINNSKPEEENQQKNLGKDENEAKTTTLDDDLPYISSDWTAYERLLDDYFS